MKTITADALNLGDYDEIIDVRAPVEFDSDHLPGALNLPVLDDQERVTVGTIYKQESVFEARKIGASFVSANISRYLAGELRDRPGGYKPLLYCWRGAQRSRSMATVFDEVGWPVTLLEGGYKAFRGRVLSELGEIPKRFTYRVLAGLTGTGKTEILKELAARGDQVLDLEGLANHQGSLLGEPEGGQNMSQKHFETRLWHALTGFDVAKPVWTEAESAKIGQVFCPKALLEMLRASVRVEVEVPMDDRVAYLQANYRGWESRKEVLMNRLKWLNRRHGQAEIDAWRELVEAGRWQEFVHRLLETHYDPAYRSALEKNAQGPGRSMQASELLDGGCARAAESLLAMDFGLLTPILEER
ncbi:MAG: tRNA 2-selenouridine(34) synthase MnmH [Myxococcales bacterium]|nr:tRNA 2-selenouridine(34) synthase MnmH [Myxococcales bacterium]